jgi:hypothetical protein
VHLPSVVILLVANLRHVWLWITFVNMKKWGWIFVIFLMTACEEKHEKMGKPLSNDAAQLFFFSVHDQDTTLHILLNSDTLSFHQNHPKQFHLLSTTIFGYFEALNQTSSILGITYPKEIKSQKLQQQILNKSTIDLQSASGELNKEALFQYPAQVILYSPFEPAPSPVPSQSIVIPFCDYQEKSALARLEWIKVIGWLTGQSPAANHYYQEVRKKLQHHYALKNPKSILIGSHDGQHFYWSSKNSAVNQLAVDAGFTVLGNDQSGNAILEKEPLWQLLQAQPEVLLLLTTPQIAQMQDQLKQWKNQFHVNVWVIDVDKTAYFQSSILHPDWLLEDLKCLSHGQNSSHFIQSPF